MDIKWTHIAIEDFRYWEKQNIAQCSRIKKLIEDIKSNPFRGIGKPEPLKYGLSGLWSRRINYEHRLIYEVKDKMVIIHQCRHHYRKNKK